MYAIISDMKPPLFVRELSANERKALQAGLRSPSAFTLRRCQILLLSAKREPPSQIARTLGCVTQTVRNVINAFNAKGLACLQAESRRPKTVRPIFDSHKCEHLRALLHQSPRTYGKPTSLWTLELAAEVCCAQGLSQHQLSIETIRQALQRLGVSWQRAKNWISSPDPQYALKKSGASD